MNKIKLIAAILFFTNIAHSQMAVVDGGLNNAAAKQTTLSIKGLSESFQQGKTLIKTYDGIKEGIEVYKKVSGSIRDSKRVAYLIQDLYDIVGEAGKTMQIISQSNLSKSSIINADRSISNILENTDDNMNQLTLILTDNKINSDDGQRLVLINQIHSSSTEDKQKLESIKSFYTEMDNNQALYDKIKKERTQ
jgi:hypothetical protein